MKIGIFFSHACKELLYESVKYITAPNLITQDMWDLNGERFLYCLEKFLKSFYLKYEAIHFRRPI